MNRTFIIGDIHGNEKVFEHRLNNSQYTFKAEDSLICVGDVGIKYGQFYNEALLWEMRKFPGTVYIMRGNHDNRYWRDNVDISETYTSYIERPHIGWIIENDLLYHEDYPNIKYVRDEGGIYNINDNNVLFIPGAYSIDKFYRLKNKLAYEPQEQLTQNELNTLYNLVQSNRNIDYVISHTAPLGTQVYYDDLFLPFIDQSQVDKHMEYFLDEINNLLHNKYKHWYFGHFHDDRTFGKFTMVYNKIQEIGENSGQ